MYSWFWAKIKVLPSRFLRVMWLPNMVILLYMERSLRKFSVDFVLISSMPATKQSQRALNLGQYAMKAGSPSQTLTFWLICQKQKVENPSDLNDHDVISFDNDPIISISRSDTESNRSTILSDISEDNDVPMHKNMNGLLTWLIDGQKKLKEKLSRLTKDSKSSAKTYYKPQGTQ